MRFLAWLCWTSISQCIKRGISILSMWLLRGASEEMGVVRLLDIASNTPVHLFPAYMWTAVGYIIGYSSWKQTYSLQPHSTSSQVYASACQLWSLLLMLEGRLRDTAQGITVHNPDRCAGEGRKVLCGTPLKIRKWEQGGSHFWTERYRAGWMKQWDEVMSST